MLNHNNPILKELDDFINRELGIAFAFEESRLIPIFSKAVPTAAIMFTKDHGVAIQLIFNEDFWKTLTYYERCFVFAHEVYHVLLDHGRRGSAYFATIEEKLHNWRRLNKAQDVCINEILKRDYFSSVHESMFPTVYPMMCDLKNCFNNDPAVLPDQNFIYYYELMTVQDQNATKMDGQFVLGDGQGGDLIDCELPQDIAEALGKLIEELNSGTPSGGNGEGKAPAENEAAVDQIENQIDEITSRANNGTPEQHEKNEATHKGYGLGGDPGGNIQVKIEVEVVDTLDDALKHIVRKSKKIYNAKVATSWSKFNRRTAAIPKTGIHIPVYDVTRPDHKPHIAVYADVSGSVEAWSSKFFKLISELDLDKYEIKLFAWASYVSEAIIEKGIARYNNTGYGTNIANVFDNFKKQTENFDAVVVLTDGEYSLSNYQNIKSFDNWYFFYTPGSRTNHPAGSNHFLLKSK